MTLEEKFAAMTAATSPPYLIDGLRELGYVYCVEGENSHDHELTVTLDGTLYLKGAQAAFWRELMRLVGPRAEWQ